MSRYFVHGSLLGYWLFFSFISVVFIFYNTLRIKSIPYRGRLLWFFISYFSPLHSVITSYPGLFWFCQIYQVEFGLGAFVSALPSAWSALSPDHCVTDSFISFCSIYHILRDHTNWSQLPTPHFLPLLVFTSLITIWNYLVHVFVYLFLSPFSKMHCSWELTYLDYHCI